MPRLRGHHLVCLHFFNGMGYDARFIEDLGTILGRAAGEAVEVVSGPDDVCGHCRHLDGDRCAYRAGAEEEISAMDAEALRLLGVFRGSSVRWKELRLRIPEVFSLWHGTYCEGCDWRKACEESAWFRELCETGERGDCPQSP